jgi:hypothetical protein
MRNPPFVLLLALIWTQFDVKCSARIGETRQQCDQRYGRPTDVQSGAVSYSKNGILIDARFVDGICRQISYYKAWDDKAEEIPFSDDELKALLAANSLDGKRTWNLLKEHVWTSDDGYEAFVYQNALFMIRPKAKANSLDGF